MIDLILFAFATLCIAALLMCGLFGWLLAGAWIGAGVAFVIATKSRGWLADLAFVLTWPIHWALEV